MIMDKDTIKQLLADGVISQEVAEKYFPELAESDDERIRKELIEFVKSRGGFKQEYIAWLEKQGNNPYSGVTFEYDGHTWGMCARDCGVDILLDSKLIQHIEKQGEQKQIDYPYVTGWRRNYEGNKPQIKHSVLMLTTHGVAEGEWLGKDWCQYRWSCEIKDKDVLYWLHLSDLESLEKELIEQKPAEQEWSEEEKGNVDIIVSRLEDDIEYWESRSKRRVDEDKRVIDWLKSLKGRVAQQPKQEWNEEDENMLQSILDEYKSMMPEKRDWLTKRLKYLRPQYNQDWDEDDKNRFNNLRLLVGESDENEPTKKGFIKFINRLQSLRPQKQWKPTEKQIYSLDSYEPIPLTAKILEKNDFVANKHVYPYPYYEYEDKVNEIVIGVGFPQGDKTKYKKPFVYIDNKDAFIEHLPCIYVHQLQHALHLCGIDKQIVL